MCTTTLYLVRDTTACMLIIPGVRIIYIYIYLESGMAISYHARWPREHRRAIKAANRIPLVRPYQVQQQSVPDTRLYSSLVWFLYVDKLKRAWVEAAGGSWNSVPVRTIFWRGKGPQSAYNDAVITPKTTVCVCVFYRYFSQSTFITSTAVVVFVTHAMIEVSRYTVFLAKMVSEWRGSLIQKRWKIRPLNFCMILVLYPGHGSFHPVTQQFIFLRIRFSGEVLSSQTDEPHRKSGASLLEHASRADPSYQVQCCGKYELMHIPRSTPHTCYALLYPSHYQSIAVSIIRSSLAYIIK